MKYYRNEQGAVHAFYTDGSQDDYITNDMIQMTDDEVDRHLNPQKYMTDEEKYALYILKLKPLKRRQFMRALVMSGFDLDQIEATISSIEDPQTRQLALIDWRDATEFERTDDTLIMMSSMLGLTSEQVDALWEFGLTL